MRTIGVTDHAPDKVALMFRDKLGVDPSDVMFLLGERLPKKTRKTYVFFLDSNTFRLNLNKVNSQHYRDKVGVVFGSPLALKDFEGIKFADFQESFDEHINAFEIGFNLNKPDVKTYDVEVHHSQEDYGTKVIRKLESFTGILTQFMTFVYTMPSSTHQKPVKEMACNWLVGNTNEKDLKRKVDYLCLDCPLSDKQIERLMYLLTSESARTYKAALQEAKLLSNRNGPEFVDIVNRYKVSGYELRYVLSIASPQNKQS